MNNFNRGLFNHAAAVQKFFYDDWDYREKRIEIQKGYQNITLYFLKTEEFQEDFIRNVCNYFSNISKTHFKIGVSEPTHCLFIKIY